MRYSEFRDSIHRELRKHPSGLPWKELKESLDLPYDRPCPTWMEHLGKEIGLKRDSRRGRELIWRL